MSTDTNIETAIQARDEGEPIYHVAPNSGGWAVKRADEEGNSTIYPNKLAAVSAARRTLNGVRSGRLIVHRKDGSIESDEHAFRFSVPIDKVRDYLEEMSPLAASAHAIREGALMRELSEKTGESPDEILRKALALYKAATEAIEQGKAVGITEDPNVLEYEFVGF